MLAEDEAIIRLDLAELLAEEGYEVVGETGRGDEVEALVRALEPDLAVLDIKMPGLDGLSAARRITAERRTAVVILTAFSQRELIEEAREAGAMGYLVKPFQKAELVAAIEMALGRHRDLRSAEEKLAARKLIDRAKASLIEREGLTEAEAFQRLQREAMDTRVTMRVVAEAILDGAARTGSTLRRDGQDPAP